MTPLAGRLLAYPMPNRPGCWAYRQLADGRLLDIELSLDEWHALHDQALADLNQKVDRLNQHPLNLAALELLHHYRLSVGSPGGLKWIHILSLAIIGLPDGKGKENDPPWSQFTILTSGPAQMEAALIRLEEANVEPHELSAMEPEEAARTILSALELNGLDDD